MADCKPVSTPMEIGYKLTKSDDSPAVNQSEYRYVQGTLDYGLWYPRNNDFTLVGFTDSDWAGCLDDRKSTSGAAFFLGDCLVAWHSKKQDCVTLSTADDITVTIDFSGIGISLQWHKAFFYLGSEDVVFPYRFPYDKVQC
ncbi:uncharacterized mitochondrial protein AtMg00810-like [Cryptomeria japonica]|uniref:uncharacterized mitochondrial protein AtMg00810-like n=1 Tax=Cryptomeria japonica TaxID=3369 RepID=UPI0027DA8256|nr:uncharacterized mitochondrial protein AtMg00810-like [Cryptomeria japonica]